MQVPNLQQKLSFELQTHQFQLITTVKFQNTPYQVGDNIRIRSDLHSQHDLYAKILSIIQAKNLTPFPLMYVAWFQHPHNQLIATLAQQQLSHKELVLTQDKDWQYIEAVKGKIQVVSEDDFIRKDPSEQQRQDLFFCRSYLTDKKQLVIDSKKHCYCQSYHIPNHPLVLCQMCHVFYHASCGKGQEGRCMRCSC